MMSGMDTTPPAHSDRRQLAQTAAEAILNAVPYAGGSLAVILAAALDHKLTKRREQWFTELAEAVEDLRRQFDGFDPDTLAENDAFVDAVVTAMRIVDRTSQAEKLDMLRNAVVNSVLPTAPDEDIQGLYFSLIDDLTPTHMRLLILLSDPPGWFDDRPHLERPQFGMSSSRTHLISAAMPELADKGQEMVGRFYAALSDGGLVNASLGGMMTAGAAWQPATTDFAKGFLAFLRDPRMH
jgi:hypothetical protein